MLAEKTSSLRNNTDKVLTEVIPLISFPLNSFVFLFSSDVCLSLYYGPPPSHQRKHCCCPVSLFLLLRAHPLSVASVCMHASKPWNFKLLKKMPSFFLFFPLPATRTCDIHFVCMSLWKHAGGPFKASLFEETCFTGCHCIYCSIMHLPVVTPAAFPTHRICNSVSKPNSNQKTKCHVDFLSCSRVKLTWWITANLQITYYSKCISV